MTSAGKMSLNLSRQWYPEENRSSMKQVEGHLLYKADETFLEILVSVLCEPSLQGEPVRQHMFVLEDQ